MPNHGMTPHVFGTTLSAQARYAARVREILDCGFAGRPVCKEYLVSDKIQNPRVLLKKARLPRARHSDGEG